MTTVSMTPNRYPRSAIAPLYIGLASTVVSMLVLYIGQAAASVLADHIRSGYPAYDMARIDAAAMTYLVYLSVVGALGIIGWMLTIWATSAGKGWARQLAAALFVTGTSIALFNLLVADGRTAHLFTSVDGMERFDLPPGVRARVVEPGAPARLRCASDS